MRVLLDECIPRPLMSHLDGHDVATVQSLGWSGTVNGALLKRIGDAAFDAFITMDKSLPSQQKLSRLPFGVVLLRAKSNKLVDLEPLAPGILRALNALRPGQVVHVSRP